MLARAGLGDEAGFAHLFGQQGLSEHVVDLVRAGVVQVLALEVDLRAAEVPGHFFRVIQAAGPARVLIKQRGKLPVEFRVVLIVVICLFQFDDGVHQRFRDVLAAVDAEASAGIGHSESPSLTARMNARILL